MKCWGPLYLCSPLTPSEVDWDLLYEEEEEESEVDMKSHGSVITHLLSQVTQQQVPALSRFWESLEDLIATPAR